MEVVRGAGTIGLASFTGPSTICDGAGLAAPGLSVAARVKDWKIGAGEVLSSLRGCSLCCGVGAITPGDLLALFRITGVELFGAAAALRAFTSMPSDFDGILRKLSSISELRF